MKLSPSLKNTLISAFALITFTVAAVLILSLTNAFLPKYTPKLDLSTVSILNGMQPTGESDDVALENGYFAMITPGDLDAWNEQNATRGKVVAVYRAEKGEGEGTVFVETTTTGFRNAEIILLTAISPEGVLLKITPRRISDSYYNAADLVRFNDFLMTTPIQAQDLTSAVLKPFIYDSQATYTTDGLSAGVSLAAAMYQTVSETAGGIEYES